MLPIIRATRPSIRRRRRAAIIAGLLNLLGLAFVAGIMSLTFVGAAVCKPNESIVQCLKN